MTRRRTSKAPTGESAPAEVIEKINLQEYRARSLSKLTNNIGIYALCDLDKVPIYVGQSRDGIRSRVQRHLTSARSDVIANRQLDVWEVAYVWAWPMSGSTKAAMTEIECFLINEFHAKKALMNGKIPPAPSTAPKLPTKQEIQVLPSEEIEKRKDPLLRLPRQAAQFTNLFSHILEVKDNSEQRRALEAHFSRLSAYYKDFMSGPERSDVDEPEP
jgi:hypothetical protein